MEEVSYKKMKTQYRHSYRDRHGIAQEKTVRGKTYRARYLEVCKMLIRIGAGRNDLIWDLGCGDGVFMSRHGAIFKNRIIGLDISLSSLHHIRQSGNVCLIQGDIENLPVKSQAIQRAIVIETLEHLIDIGKGLKEIRRCLAKDGIAVITVPSLLNPRNINFYGNGSYLKGFLRMLLAMPKGFKKCKWSDDQGKEYPHFEYAKWKVKKTVKTTGLAVLRMGKMPVIFNSEEGSLVERIVNKVTGNRLGECHILMVAR